MGCLFEKRCKGVVGSSRKTMQRYNKKSEYANFFGKKMSF